jgi:hypothetical protein
MVSRLVVSKADTCDARALLADSPDIAASAGIFLGTFAQETLFGTVSGSGTANGQGTAAISLVFVSTGGTVVFAGATGESVASIVVTSAGLTTDSESGTYAGSLPLVAAPEPGSLMLSISVAVVMSCLRRRWTPWVNPPPVAILLSCWLASS